MCIMENPVMIGIVGLGRWARTLTSWLMHVRGYN